MSTRQPPRQTPAVRRRLGSPSRCSPFLNRSRLKRLVFSTPRHQPGHIDPKPVQRHDSDSVAHELEVLQTLVVTELEGPFAFGPD